jgi:hypothetical protein
MQMLLDGRDRHDVAMCVLQMLARLLGGDGTRLEHQNAGDDLEAVDTSSLEAFEGDSQRAGRRISGHSVSNKQPKPGFCVLSPPIRPNVMIQKIQDYLRSARFIWADKIALLAGFVISLLFLFLWLLAFCVVGSLGARHMWGSFGFQGVGLAILMVGTIWFMMRAANAFMGWFSHRLYPRRAS